PAINTDGYDAYYAIAAAGGVSVKGSMPKFLFGDNFQLLTRQTSEQAVEKLSDVLGLPFKLAQVRRLLKALW
ncbi:hypothetical protein, partial [Runella sp.]|uniref:hypothetical protein n=1 Tax=Runella sp. TaxID=1960881 RepID=UPI003019BBFE